MTTLRDAITFNTYIGLQALRNILFDEVTYNHYAEGKGKPGSVAKALRAYGFKERRKDKLLKTVTIYLNNVEIIESGRGRILLNDVS